MKPSTYRSLLLFVGFCACAAASEAQRRSITDVVPLEDLAAVVEGLRQRLLAMTADEATFADNSHKVSRDAQTLAAVGLALALDEKEHPLRLAAPGIVAAAGQLAAAKDYPAAEKARLALDQAFDDKPGQGQPPTPGKVGSMGQLMKQASFAQNRLKRGLSRLADDTDAKAQDAALLAALAQAIVYDLDRAETPEKRDDWYRFCGQMRDRAGNLNRMVRAVDKEGTAHALRELGQSCEACHAAFR